MNDICLWTTEPVFLWFWKSNASIMSSPKLGFIIITPPSLVLPTLLKTSLRSPQKFLMVCVASPPSSLTLTTIPSTLVRIVTYISSALRMFLTHKVMRMTRMVATIPTAILPSIPWIWIATSTCPRRMYIRRTPPLSVICGTSTNIVIPSRIPIPVGPWITAEFATSTAPFP